MPVTLHVWRVPRRRVATAMIRIAFPGVRDVRFAKFVGTSAGFLPRDADLTRYAAITVSDAPVRLNKWDNLAVASARVELEPLLSRGSWSGQQPFTFPDKSEMSRSEVPGGVGGGVHGGAGGEAHGGPDRAVHSGANGTVHSGANGTVHSGANGAVHGGAVHGGAVHGGAGGEACGGADRAVHSGAGGEAYGGTGGEVRGGTESGVPNPMVLALTRARLRPTKMRTFYRAVPAVVPEVEGAPGLLARFGIGEAPIGYQGTISLWRNAADLARFAYRQPEHRAVIARTPADRWYSEELFARFAVREISGDRAVLGWVAGDEEGVTRR